MKQNSGEREERLTMCGGRGRRRRAAEFPLRVCVLYQCQLRTGNTLEREGDRKLARQDHPCDGHVILQGMPLQSDKMS